MEETTTKTPEELKKEEKLAKRREADAKKRADAKAKKEVEANKTEEPKVEEPKVEEPKADEPKVLKAILKTVLGEVVDNKDYFYKGIVPAGFHGTCGKPVDREDLIEVFHKVFKPEDNILFYRQLDKEVYIVIIPLKYSMEVGERQDSLDGDFQKHAISFLNEGSVNLDTLRLKLERIEKFVNYSDR